MEATLRDIKTVLDGAAGIQGYALIGAFAMGAWVSPRTTMDLDVLVSVFRRPGQVMGAVRSDLISREWLVALYSGEHPNIPHRLRAQSPRGVAVDLIFGLSAIHKRIVRESDTVKIGKRLRFPIAGPEAIVVLKLIAGRRQDLIDAERLLAEAELDEVFLFSLARQAKVEKDVRRVARRAGWPI